MKDPGKKKQVKAPRQQKFARAEKPAEAPRAQEGREEKAGPPGYDPEKIAAAYEQGMKDYASYYQQAALSPYDPVEIPYAGQMAGDYGQTLGTYEEKLGFLAQGQAAFEAAMAYMSALTGKEREDYIRTWKEYLESLLKTSKELQGEIEASLQALSEKTAP